MAVRLPLVIITGTVQQLPAGDSISSGNLAFNQHVISGDTVVPAGATATVERYVEVAAGVVLEIDLDGDLGIE